MSPASRSLPRGLGWVGERGALLRWIVRLLALCAVLAATACGDGNEAPLVFDSVPPTTTALPTTTKPAGPQLGPWIDVTANLAGMPSECGNMSYVAAHPTSDQLIAGVALRGLLANGPWTDEWTTLGAEGSLAQITNRTASIIFDPEDANRFWQSGHSGGPGAFRTTDGGRTFVRLGDLEHLDGLSVDLSDPLRRTLLAGPHERTDLFRSTDGGDTWINIGPSLPPDIGFPSDPLVLDAEVHLVGTRTWGPGTTGIFRTADSGSSWQRVATGGVSGPPLVARDGSVYWPLQSGAALRSIDRGVTWTTAAPPELLASYNIVELADGRLASVGRTHVIVSADQGRSWSALGPPLGPNGAFGLAFSPARNAIYLWQWDCGAVVPAGAVQRLDLAPTG